MHIQPQGTTSRVSSTKSPVFSGELPPSSAQSASAKHAINKYQQINKSTNINNYSTGDITNDAPHNEPNYPVTGQIEPQLSMIRLDPVNTEKQSVIFNYTNIVLSDSMEKVLNRGLNFSILPKKMDMTQLRVDLKRFKRSAIWKEYFYGRDQGKLEKQIFKTNKSNLPKNYQIPEGLKIFLNSVEWELYDPRSRNQAKCNISPEEMEALEDLIKLQKDKKIVIRECDKGPELSFSHTLST